MTEIKKIKNKKLIIKIKIKKILTTFRSSVRILFSKFPAFIANKKLTFK